jgi:hypothetical protein
MLTRLCHYAARCSAICLISAVCMVTSTAQFEQCCYQSSSTSPCSLGFGYPYSGECSTTINCAGPVCTNEVATKSVWAYNGCVNRAGSIYSGAYGTLVYAGGEVHDVSGSPLASYYTDRNCLTGLETDTGGIVVPCF